MFFRCFVGLAVYSTFLLQPGCAGQRRVMKASPSWARDARWYHVVVPRFHNGDRSNDPPNTQPWTVDWPPVGDPSAAGEETAAEVKETDLDARHYGGDLQGLQARLPYLKDLGVNGLVLTPIFRATSERNHDTIDWRHVDDTFGVKGTLAKITGETLNPETWKFSASDRVFLDFLKKAHDQDFRIVLECGFGPIDEGHLRNVTKRWMDPNRDGDSSDGIDGWVLKRVDEIDAKTWKKWRDHVKKINPEALLIGDVPKGASAKLVGKAFDGRIGHDVGDAIRRFFAARDKTYTLKKFFDDLNTSQKRHSLGTNLVTFSTLGGADAERLFTALSHPATSPAAKTPLPKTPVPIEDTVNRWRLATVFQHFYLGAPVTYYGDEVGMMGASAPYNRAPMWWTDLPGITMKPGTYRDDFYALIRFLNSRRGVDQPLRHGKCRLIVLDEQRQLLALSRSLPGNEVILVMNYGSTKQEVKLTAGRPRQLIGVLSPPLKPRSAQRGKGKPAVPSDVTKIPKLRLGGSRQFVDENGQISLWVKPWSVRIVLVKDEIPTRENKVDPKKPPKDVAGPRKGPQKPGAP